jgi:hypothetical protein
MWNDYGIRPEIERARKTLALTLEQFRPLGLTEWPAVEKRMYLEFTVQTGKLARWSWPWAQPTDHMPEAALAFEYAELATYLPSLIDRNEKCFVFFEGVAREQTKFWWYECCTETLLAVMDELWGCEIGIMDKHYRWLLMLTHHDILVGIGTPVAERLQRLKARVTGAKQ